mmetsp:Transcript_3595/g.10004  ORF Transcript_3595/g.10004 Transcript_3595/m.10004 type:complete len:171 (-) Transcript_3595:1864-2376(-)
MRALKNSGLNWMSSAAAAVMTPLRAPNSSGPGKGDESLATSGAGAAVRTDNPQLIELSKRVEYALNDEFSPRSVRLIVPSNSPRFIKREAKSVKRQVEIDRSVQVDAAIVRVMKRSGSMTLSDLLVATASELAALFVPDAKLVKSRLEHLIESEYLERDANDSALFKYVA